MLRAARRAREAAERPAAPPTPAPAPAPKRRQPRPNPARLAKWEAQWQAEQADAEAELIARGVAEIGWSRSPMRLSPDTYARVSSDDQEKDGLSLPAQDKETLAYVAARETWAFGGAFVDVQTSSVVNRADYQRMLAAARATSASGKRVAIVVVKQTRFGRDIEELARAWKELGHLDAELHATRDGGLIADPLM